MSPISVSPAGAARRTTLATLLALAASACSGGGTAAPPAGPVPPPIVDPWIDPTNEPLPETPRARGPIALFSSSAESTASAYAAEGRVEPDVDGALVTTVTLALDGGTPEPVTLTSGAFSVALTLQAGSNSVEVVSTDAAGRTSADSFPVFYRTGQPSSADLIAAARQAGTISAEQALAYRVYASFADPRLPLVYRGDDTQADYHGVLGELAAAAPTLSEAAKDELGPFLAPPFYRAPPVTAAGAAAVRQAVGALPCNPLRTNESCPIDTTGWASVPGSFVRVWYPAASAAFDLPRANHVIETLEGSVGAALKLNALMGHAPLSDGGGPLDGGDDRLDIVLLPQLTGGNPARTVPSTWTKAARSSVFILLRSGLSLAETAGHAVHEYMHALQWARPVGGSGGLIFSFRTLAESTAQWAQYYVLKPYGNNEHRKANGAAFREIWKGLLHGTDAESDLAYGAYLFVLYLHKEVARDAVVVRKLWDAAARGNEVAALSAGIRNYGTTLEAVWPRFANVLWNRGPSRKLRDWDQLPEGGPEPFSNVLESLSPGSAGLEAASVRPTTKFLSALYARVTLVDPGCPDCTRSLVVLNGHTFRVGQGQSTFKATTPAVFAIDPATRKGAALWVMERKGGSWAAPEDWTDVRSDGNFPGFRLYCRERAAERLDELVLVFTFADPARPAEAYTAAGDGTSVYASNVLCDRAVGEAHFSRTVSGTTLTRTYDATGWQFAGARGAEVAVSTSGGYAVYGFQLGFNGGSMAWTTSGTAGSCTYSGSGTRDAPAGNPLVQLLTFPFSLSPVRAYQFNGFVVDPMKFPESKECRDAQGVVTTTPGEYDAFVDYMFPSLGLTLGVSILDYPRWTFAADGKSMRGDGSYTLFGGVQGTWNVTSTSP